MKNESWAILASRKQQQILDFFTQFIDVYHLFYQICLLVFI